MGNGKVINDVLVHLFNEVWQLEKSALTAGEFKDLTYNDMHIIEAVGLDGQKCQILRLLCISRWGLSRLP